MTQSSRLLKRNSVNTAEPQTADRDVDSEPPTGSFSGIRSIAVIGAGVQGRTFALRCAQAGFKTVLEDVMPAKLRRAQEELLELDSPTADHRLHLSFALTVEDAVRDADVAIDFVPDELESKLEIFSLLDRMAPPKTILCTPTRVLSISDLASCTYRADRCVALHFAGPEILASPLRLVPGDRMDPALAVAVQQWLERLGCAVSAGTDFASELKR